MVCLVNVTERLLDELLDDILSKVDNFCGCERCRKDVAAIALNTLPANYVATEEGEVKKRVSLLEAQMRIDVTQAVMKAVEIVSKNPHHER
ncbi:MAG: late competence development ComFB family protein [Clostridiales bacterium]|nr:late competence development ComFB family protein [Clostridiales bacterium]MCF8021310.1 late competence development ComFB family protein [Clostridiales bacterium]